MKIVIFMARIDLSELPCLSTYNSPTLIAFSTLEFDKMRYDRHKSLKLHTTDYD